MYKFDVLAIARVVVNVALRKYEIMSTRNRCFVNETNFMSRLLLL
jgi:hypothetical protein